MIEEYVTCPFCGLMSIFQYVAVEPDIRYACQRCKRVVTVLRGVIVPPPPKLLKDEYHVGINIVES